MQVITGFFGSGTRAAQLGLGAAFAHSFKKLARLVKTRSQLNNKYGTFFFQSVMLLSPQRFYRRLWSLNMA
jgi:hypothetical protein